MSAAPTTGSGMRHRQRMRERCCSRLGAGPWMTLQASCTGVRGQSVFSTLVSLMGSFDAAEDALHDAVIATSERLLGEGVPEAAPDALSGLVQISNPSAGEERGKSRRKLSMRSRSVCHQRRASDSKNLLVPCVPESLRQRNGKRHLPHFIHRGDWHDVLLHQRRGQWQPDLPSLLPHLRQSSVCQFFGEPAVSRRATRHIGRSFFNQTRDQYVGVQRAELGMLGRNPEI